MFFMPCSSVTSTALVKSLEDTKKAHPEVREKHCHFAVVPCEGEVDIIQYQAVCYHSSVTWVLTHHDVSACILVPGTEQGLRKSSTLGTNPQGVGPAQPEQHILVVSEERTLDLESERPSSSPALSPPQASVFLSVKPR